jgi:uncharacterized protein YkwD
MSTPELLRWRPTGPVAWAAVAAAVLAVLGIVFLVVGPLAAGPARTDALPVTTASPGPHPVASGPAAASDASAPPSAGTRLSALEDQLVQLLNDARDHKHCDKLRNDGHLRSAARAHSADMAAGGFVDDKGSDGSSPGDRMKKAGYKHPRDEDVGSGYTSARAALDDWSADRDQRGPLGDCDLKAVGVGVVAAADGKLYWTADFGG